MNYKDKKDIRYFNMGGVKTYTSVQSLYEKLNKVEQFHYLELIPLSCHLYSHAGLRKT